VLVTPASSAAYSDIEDEYYKQMPNVIQIFQDKKDINFDRFSAS